MIKGFVNELRAAFPDLQVTIDPLIGEGNMTAWRRTHTGTHREAIHGFHPSGKKISWEDFQKGMEFNMQLDDLEVAFYDNTVIVTGFENGPARMPNGRVIDGKRKYTSVWINEKGE